jgi:hypothetical protein
VLSGYNAAYLDRQDGRGDELSIREVPCPLGR